MEDPPSGAFWLGPDSDIDLFVESEADERWSLMDLVRADDDSSFLFGRKVHLVNRKNLEHSENPIRRNAILNSTKVLYVENEGGDAQTGR